MNMFTIEERIHCWTEEEILECLEYAPEKSKKIIRQFDLYDYEDLGEFFLRITENLIYENELNEIKIEEYNEDEHEPLGIQIHNDRSDVTVITRKEDDLPEEIYGVECRSAFIDDLIEFQSY